MMSQGQKLIDSLQDANRDLEARLKNAEEQGYMARHQLVELQEANDLYETASKNLEKEKAELLVQISEQKLEVF